MNIAFDATAILGPMSKNRGIGNYSLNQFSTMIRTDTKNQYYFFNLLEHDFSLSNLLNLDCVDELALYSGPNCFLLKDKTYEEIVGDIIKKFISQNKIDVFYITSPFETCNVQYKKEWFANCKTIAMVYDIIPYVMKEHYLADANTYSWYMECIDMLRWADRLQVISQSVKDDLVSELGFDEDRIDVIWGGVDKRYKEINISEKKKEDILDKFHIIDEYVMCTGGDDERKNISGLIDAYSHLPADVIKKYQLVIVCKLSEGSKNKYEDIINKREVTGRVILTNYVSNEELLILYNLAALMAFPSTYEGFGLPVVEAWACGTPVLTSNNSSLVQIAGDAAVLVNPFDTKDIARGLAYALTECDLQELQKKGRERLKEFSWEKVASTAVRSVEKLQLSSIKSNKKKKIAFFTPLPPIESGISDYSVDLIRELLHHYDIDVYIDEGYIPQVDFEDNVSIISHTKFEDNIPIYDNIVYQMGNSTYHIYMYKYIQTYRGIVVLHDYNLHGVIYYCAFQEHGTDYALYEQMLEEDYPLETVKDYVNNFKTGICPLKKYEWEVNGVITNYAEKIIVHSYDAQEKLLKKNIRNAVKHVWSFVNLDGTTKEMHKQEIRKKYGVAETDIVISAFGHIHETKRIIPILNAFERLAEEYNNIKLLLVGKLSDTLEDSFYATVDRLQIKDRVSVTGYVSLDEFEEYIHMADICLNLRYPYNGETSASMIRNLAAGNALIVNNIGSFSELPDDVCIKIPKVELMTEAEEIQEIISAVEWCLNKTVKCDLMRERAKQFAVEYLDVKKAAKDYCTIIEDDASCSLNEELLRQIARYLQDMQCPKEKVQLVSETLAWAKG